MRKLLALLMTLILGLICAGLAVADDAADTKALVENGVVMAKEKGMEPTLKAIGDPKGPFVKGDLYLFAGSLDKVTATAHPFAADKLVGPDLTNLKDSKGSQFFIKFKEIAEKPGSGWVEYWWPKPGEKEPSLKKTFIMRVPGQDAYIAAGYYPK
ncbi:MAG: cache domain-containing protein [Desulfomonile sp.]